VAYYDSNLEIRALELRYRIFVRSQVVLVMLPRGAGHPVAVDVIPPQSSSMSTVETRVRKQTKSAVETAYRFGLDRARAHFLACLAGSSAVPAFF